MILVMVEEENLFRGVEEALLHLVVEEEMPLSWATEQVNSPDNPLRMKARAEDREMEEVQMMRGPLTYLAEEPVLNMPERKVEVVEQKQWKPKEQQLSKP